jgi:urease accessory protein
VNLRLLQLSDSALPISGYTHSWGLEAAVAQRRVHDPESLERWTAGWLRNSVGPLEGVLVAAACRRDCGSEPVRLVELNELAETSQVPVSTRHASREMGDQLLKLGATWNWSGAAADRILRLKPEGWYHCVVFGWLGSVAGAEPREVLAAYLHQAALGMIGAGVRVIPVGHTHGQQILAYLHETIDTLVDELVDRSPEMAGARCPFYEVLCHDQTQLYARMYRS